MYPNLNAEQARQGHSNEYVAKLLDISRQLYERKKNIGRFTVEECRFLCNLYGANFEYLFKMAENTA